MKTTPTLNELIYTVYHTVRSRITSDEELSKNYIKFLIKATRAKLIKQDANKGYTLDSYIVQGLKCVELLKVSASECCIENTDCKILRTKLQIPSVIELSHSQAITRIGSVTQLDIPFDFVEYSKVPYLSFNKYSKNRVKCFFKDNDGYLYIIVPNDIKYKLLNKITIHGVFEDPEELKVFKDCSGNSCYDDDAPFPVKYNMVEAITNTVIEKFIKSAAVAPVDNNNNNKLDLDSPTEK